MPTRETILVVEDEQTIRQFVALNDEHAGYQVIPAHDAAHAMEHMRSAVPDLMLLGWSLPGVSGIEFLRRLRLSAHTRYLPIVMLSSRSDELDKITGLDAGADDYVTTPYSPRELFARIRALLRQNAPEVTDKAVAAAGLMLDPVSFQVSDANGNSTDLALTEFKLLHFLMKHAGNIHTRAQILSLVWGENSGVEERTVDVYVRRLRKKLEGFGHMQLIRTVRDEGYCFVGPEGQSARPAAEPRQASQPVPAASLSAASALAASQAVNDPLLN